MEVLYNLLCRASYASRLSTMKPLVRFWGLYGPIFLPFGAECESPHASQTRSFLRSSKYWLSGHPQIAQCKQHHQLRGFLGKPFVAQLYESELVFHLSTNAGRQISPMDHRFHFVQKFTLALSLDKQLKTDSGKAFLLHRYLAFERVRRLTFVGLLKSLTWLPMSKFTHLVVSSQE